MSDKVTWRTYLFVGGAILSCGLGVFAVRRFRSFPERPAAENTVSDTPRITEYGEKAEVRRRDALKERNDAIRTRSACSTWTQTFEEVVIEIPVSSDVKARDVACTFKTKSLAVNVKEQSLMEGPLFQDITPDECSWELEGDGPGRTLTISLIKGAFHLGHWNHVLLEDDDSANNTTPQV